MGKLKDFVNKNKRYYIPGIDEINQLIETPRSREKTDFRRFLITSIIAGLSAVGAIIAAVFAVLTYFCG